MEITTVVVRTEVSKCRLIKLIFRSATHCHGSLVTVLCSYCENEASRRRFCVEARSCRRLTTRIRNETATPTQEKPSHGALPGARTRAWANERRVPALVRRIRLRKTGAIRLRRSFHAHSRFSSNRRRRWPRGVRRARCAASHARACSRDPYSPAS